MGSRTLALWLAFGAPLVAYVLTISGHSYWLDSGEFVAVAARLDIAHPPGHPLAVLYSSAWTMLPLGSLAWRVALGQAFAAALGSMFVCMAVHHVLARLALDERAAWILSLAGAWISALAYGVWFQGVRPEVYALQTLCMSVIVERSCALLAQERVASDARPLYAVALALGLGLANHHLIAFLVAPALLVGVVGVWRARGMRPVLHACGFGLLALCTYAYLPVRALARPVVNLGDPSTWQNFAWVLSARVYSKNLAFQAVGTLTERAVDILVLFLESFHGLTLVAALIGAYLALRHEATRRPALFLLLIVAVNSGVRAWMGSVLGNPDILGYLGPSFLIVGMLAVLFVALLLWLAQAHFAISQRAQVVVSACVLVLAACAGVWPTRDASLARFDSTDVLDDMRVRSLPPRSVVLVGNAQATFRGWELDATEVSRPDVTLVPLSFLRYPGTAQRLMERAPHIAPLIEAYFEHDLLPVEATLDLARTRPVFVELDARTHPSLYRILRPSHLMHRVIERPDLTPSLSAIATEQRANLAVVYMRLGAGAREVETSHQLLWIHYMDAIHFSAIGARELARRALDACKQLGYEQDADISALSKALSDHESQGPIDVRPFLRLDLIGR